MRKAKQMSGWEIMILNQLLKNDKRDQCKRPNKASPTKDMAVTRGGEESDNCTVLRTYSLLLRFFVNTIYVYVVIAKA